MPFLVTKELVTLYFFDIIKFGKNIERVLI